MSDRGKETGEALPGPGALAAGDFLKWLDGTQASLRQGKGRAEAPCGSCRGCCRSSMFIHIRPEEAKTIARIPRALLFAAPGLPKGHVLMGFDEKGQCPMLLGGECSIYDDRPQTCRDYDCRVFAATGIAVDSETQPEIAERVRAWEFSYESEDGRKKQRLVKEAAAFLQEKRDLFPHGSLPTYPVQLAAVAVEVYEVFNDARTWTKQEAGTWADGAIAQAILAALSEGPADSVADAAATRSGRKRSSSGV